MVVTNLIVAWAKETSECADGVGRGSDRAFGLIMASACVGFAVWRNFSPPARLTLIGVGAVLAGLAVAVPRLLAPMNLLWVRLGVLLSRVVSPLVLGLFFYAVLTPLALLLRLRGRDALRLRACADCESYWVARTPPGPAPDSLRRQF